MIYTTADIFFGVAVPMNHLTDSWYSPLKVKTNNKIRIFFLLMDREGSKSQLRHTEPPREKKKEKKNGGNVISEKFVQQLLDNTFQQEQQQSGMRFSLRGK